MSEICIFAGTGEGRTLIERLCGRGIGITACVATEYGELLLGEHSGVRVCAGRMDAQQMTEFFSENRFDVVVDATHPYAAIVTENLTAACNAAQIPYMRLERGSTSAAEDGIYVADAAACAEYLLGTQGPVLLTTGSKELAAFGKHEALRERIWARVLPMDASLKLCADNGIPSAHIIAMQGPFDEEMNLAMLRSTKARYMVTKDTGSAGGYEAKINAAKRAGVVPVIIGRPAAVRGLSPEETLHALEQRFGLAPVRKKVVLAGIGMGSCETRTGAVTAAAKRADCLIGAARMLDSFADLGKRTHEAVLSSDIIDFIRRDGAANYVVLLSGDTGFYSGAKGIIEGLGEADVEVLPGIGSLSYFCSRLKRPWQDVRAVSLHGRDCNLLHEVRRHEAVFTLLGKNGVRDALSLLTDAGMGELTVHVGERLGYPEERIVSGSARELKDQPFDALSVLLIENPDSVHSVVTHGIPDEAFERDEVPMTKSEVRSVSLSKLELTERSIIWDVGSGSGSVTVECARMAPYGKVYAVEKKESAVALTKKNCERFALSNVEVIRGSAPEALYDLPAPTHAFIGGSSGNMDVIIDLLLAKNPNVRIVANAVTLETVAELTQLCKRFEESDIVCMNIAKPRRIAGYNLMTGQNPVYVFTMQNRTKASN